MTIAEAVERIQFVYPQVYYACHTRHARERSSDSRLSGRDATILVHLDRTEPISLSALARHLGLAASTLSEATSRLEAFGYVSKGDRGGRDRRRIGLTLTSKGVAAVRASSVLEPARLGAALRRLSREERLRVIDGLSTLADACRRAS